MSKVLSVTELKKTYQGPQPVHAVNGISFHLSGGEILGFLGPNGSGKTTTIQMLLGTLSVTEGTITYFGKNLALHRSEILEKVTFASTYTSLPWILTVAENLEVFGRLYGFDRKKSEKAFNPLLERFGILNKKHTRVSGLSTGQITRLMLVKAFFIEPIVVLLDEPTASLDPDMAQDTCSFLLEQRESKGISIIFTSHKMEEVMRICDRAIFLKSGKIIADDTPKKLAHSVSSFCVKLIIGEGEERARVVIEKEGFRYSQDSRLLQVWIEEEKIPRLLDALSRASVHYTSIKIEEPTLEDFFYHIAKK